MQPEHGVHRQRVTHLIVGFLLFLFVTGKTFLKLLYLQLYLLKSSQSLLFLSDGLDVQLVHMFQFQQSAHQLQVQVHLQHITNTFDSRRGVECVAKQKSV